jgi:hypothetical protein
MLQWITTQTSDWKPKYYLALIYKSRNRVEESRSILNQLGDTPDVSFFYATRSAIDNGDASKEADLLKAHDMDKEEWRYVKKLSEYYIEKGEYAKALTLAEPFYKNHRSNYIIGLLYAKCLIQNKRYAEAGKLLLSVNVIPFEGATEGRELYRQTMLLQAIQYIRSGKYKNALDYLAKAKEFPENLGSGKPYDEDIDSRAEDYLSAACYERTNKKDAADKLLNAVAAYPALKSGYKSNMLVQALALEKTGHAEAAKELVEKKLSAEKDPAYADAMYTIFDKRQSSADARDINMLLISEIANLK